MERSNLLQVPAYDKSPVIFALRKAGETMRAWRGKRRAASLVGELSPEQVLDCGIVAPDLNIPALEVPKGLMQKLISMR